MAAEAWASQDGRELSVSDDIQNPEIESDALVMIQNLIMCFYPTVGAFSRGKCSTSESNMLTVIGINVQTGWPAGEGCISRKYLEYNHVHTDMCSS